ncbi:MAG: hypothetical protein AB7D05_10920 [Mangrovibacterium sp.]
MKRVFSCLIILSLVMLPGLLLKAQQFHLAPYGYFRLEGVDVMAFDDIYPEGHQGWTGHYHARQQGGNQR